MQLLPVLKANSIPILPVASLVFLIYTSCNPTQTSEIKEKASEAILEIIDPLPSWEDGQLKSDIISFVKRVSHPDSADYIKEKHRIAVFDNDGTLWSEQPAYFQLLFAMDRVGEMVADHPEWKTTQPFQAVLENDLSTLAQQGERGILQLIMATHAGMTPEEFSDQVKNWLNTTRHPRFNRPYTEMIFQPMLELLEYLRNNDFTVFIVSGGGIEFMRAWVEDVYGVPTHQVVGSAIKTEFVQTDDGPKIQRLPEVDFIDDKEGKPVGINKFIGKRPVFAVGNSDGDLQMLQYTAAGDGPRFMLYVHHTDSIREWAYDRDSHIGRFDQGLDQATERGWSVIDMAKHWKVIYPFELK